jgi:hypothetical protein
MKYVRLGHHEAICIHMYVNINICMYLFKSVHLNIPEICTLAARPRRETWSRRHHVGVRRRASHARAVGPLHPQHIAAAAHGAAGSTADPHAARRPQLPRSLRHTARPHRLRCRCTLGIHQRHPRPDDRGHPRTTTQCSKSKGPRRSRRNWIAGEGVESCCVSQRVDRHRQTCYIRFSSINSVHDLCVCLWAYCCSHSASGRA